MSRRHPSAGEPPNQRERGGVAWREMGVSRRFRIVDLTISAATRERPGRARRSPRRQIEAGQKNPCLAPRARRRNSCQDDPRAKTDQNGPDAFIRSVARIRGYDQLADAALDSLQNGLVAWQVRFQGRAKRDRHVIHAVNRAGSIDAIGRGVKDDRGRAGGRGVLRVNDDRGNRTRCSRASCEKLDIGSLAMMSAASASPRARMSSVVNSPGLNRG